MLDNEIETKRLSDWQPESDVTRLKILGKKVEEMGELLSVIGRCIIQGIDKHNPETHQLNKHWLEDELADNEAFSAIMLDVFDLDRDRIEKRKLAKINSKLPWVMGTAVDLLPST